MPERRSPGPVKITVMVGIISLVLGWVLAFGANFVMTDFVNRRDSMLNSHEMRIQEIERAFARQDAQYAEILRRLDRIEQSFNK